jgi:predicted HNH restriction endonuclease
MGRANRTRKARKAEAVAKFGGACQACGYLRCMRNLAFHHLGKKSFPLSERAFQFSWERLLPELSKCVLLCHNCHGEVHDGLIDLREIKPYSAFTETTS